MNEKLGFFGFITGEHLPLASPIPFFVSAFWGQPRFHGEAFPSSLINLIQDIRHLWTHFGIGGAKECQVVPHIKKVVNTSIHGREFFLLIYFNYFSKARFRRRTFHEPNLIHWIKYMKSSVSESIRNACLERLSRSFGIFSPSAAGNSTLDRLWTAFNSDAELFMYRT